VVVAPMCAPRYDSKVNIGLLIYETVSRDMGIGHVPEDDRRIVMYNPTILSLLCGIG
jgi:hypothetical protein